MTCFDVNLILYISSTSNIMADPFKKQNNFVVEAKSLNNYGDDLQFYFFISSTWQKS